MTENTPQYQGVVVFNMHDIPLVIKARSSGRGCWSLPRSLCCSPPTRVRVPGPWPLPPPDVSPPPFPPPPNPSSGLWRHGQQHAKLPHAGPRGGRRLPPGGHWRGARDQAVTRVCSSLPHSPSVPPTPTPFPTFSNSVPPRRRLADISSGGPARCLLHIYIYWVLTKKVACLLAVAITEFSNREVNESTSSLVTSVLWWLRAPWSRSLNSPSPRTKQLQ